MGVANVCLGRMGPHSEPRQRKKVGNTHKKALYSGVAGKEGGGMGWGAAGKGMSLELSIA